MYKSFFLFVFFEKSIFSCVVMFNICLQLYTQYTNMIVKKSCNLHSFNRFFGQKVVFSKGNRLTGFRPRCISDKLHFGESEFGQKVVWHTSFRSKCFEESVFGQPVFGISWESPSCYMSPAAIFTWLPNLPGCVQSDCVFTAVFCLAVS